MTITRQEIVPPIEDGLIAGEGTPARGLLFPQPSIIGPAATTLLDKLTGAGWRVFLDGRMIASGDRVSIDLQLEGLAVHAIVPANGGGKGAPVLTERDGVLADWFDRHGAVAVIVRPDHYVFGAARTVADLNEQLSDLLRRLA